MWTASSDRFVGKKEKEMKKKTAYLGVMLALALICSYAMISRTASAQRIGASAAMAASEQLSLPAGMFSCRISSVSSR